MGLTPDSFSFSLVEGAPAPATGAALVLIMSSAYNSALYYYKILILVFSKLFDIEYKALYCTHH